MLNVFPFYSFICISKCFLFTSKCFLPRKFLLPSFCLCIVYLAPDSHQQPISKIACNQLNWVNNPTSGQNLHSNNGVELATVDNYDNQTTGEDM